MNRFDRWFFHDDTPRWQRRTWRFLLVVTGLLLLAGLLWWAE